MANFSTTKQTFNEMDDKKQLRCIWNSNHLVNHSRYQKHQLNCPDRPKNVHKCQYNFLHEFRSEKEKDAHELTCEGMLRRLREQKEVADMKQRRIPGLGAPVIVENIRNDEPTDPWAEEGAKEGVKPFRAPGLNLSQEQIEDYIDKFLGDEHPCEYMLVAMSPSQKQRLWAKLTIRTNERAADNMKKSREAAIPSPSEPVFRVPRNAVVASIIQQSTSSQESENEGGEQMDVSCDPPAVALVNSGCSIAAGQPLNPGNPWAANRNPVAPSATEWPSLGSSGGQPLSGIGRGRSRPPPPSFG